MRCMATKSGDELVANTDGPMPEQLTIEEFLALFRRTPDLSNWVASADSEEYLTLITFLVERPRR